MSGHEVELIDLLRVLWRQKWVIIVTFVAAVVAAWGASRVIAPNYEIETSLLLLPSLSSQLGAEAVGSRLAPEAYEELAVSTTLLELVMASAALPEDTTLRDLKNRFSVSVRRLSSEGELLLSTRITGTSRERLVDMAQAWTKAFSDTYGELFQDRITRSYEYVSENYVETETQLDALVEERTAFLAEHPLVVLRAEAAALEGSVTRYNGDLLEARKEMETAEAYLAAREGGSPAQLPTYVLTGALDPATLTGALAYGLSAAEFRDLMETRIEDLEEATASIGSQLAAKQQTIDLAEATLSSLDRQIALLESAHAELALKLQDARIALAETPEPIRVIDEPLVPGAPSQPKKTTNIAVAGFLGLLIGTLLAFFVDYLARVRQQERDDNSASPGRKGQPPPHSAERGPGREHAGESSSAS